MRRWVRSATEADLVFLQQLYQEYYPLQPMAERFFTEKINKEEIFIALEDQTPRGYLLLEKRSVLFLPYLHEPFLMRGEEHEGFDTKLMMTVESYCKQLGFQKVITSCAEQNQNARTRNKQRGYQEGGVLSHLRSDGKNEIVMIKSLIEEEL